MTKFHVSFEASAAVGLTFEIEAEDEDDAWAIAEERFGGRGQLNPVLEVTSLNFPFASSFIELDENDFDIVEVEPAEDQ